MLFENDPYIACAHCFTEAFDEVTAFRVLDPHRQMLMLDTEEAWGSSTNQDVFHDYVLTAIANQQDVHRLDRPFAPPTPGGLTPFSAARNHQAMAVVSTPAAVHSGAAVHMRTPGPVGPEPEQEMLVPLGTGRGASCQSPKTKLRIL
eukprot:1633601-Pyramimonas_sp.AAC.1